jgi:hypothetical protein
MSATPAPFATSSPLIVPSGATTGQRYDASSPDNSPRPKPHATDENEKGISDTPESIKLQAEYHLSARKSSPPGQSHECLFHFEEVSAILIGSGSD